MFQYWSTAWGGEWDGVGVAPGAGPEIQQHHDDHPDLASICENMAELHRRGHRHGDALGRYREALRIRTLHHAGEGDGGGGEGGGGGAVLGLTLSVADCLRAMARWDEAAEMYDAIVRRDLLANQLRRLDPRLKREAAEAHARRGRCFSM